VWSLVDVQRGQPVARAVSRADSFLTRLVGLLGRRSLARDEGLWIEPCDSVHTFFMRFPIDVAFVDRKGTVIRRIDSLRPWRATRIHANARACVELAAGTLAAAGVEEGTRLALVAQSRLSGSSQSQATDGASAS
jgi:uncharacterized membrane protein (UPF0127 family)